MERRISENIFAAIAKLLLVPKIKKNLETAEKMLEDDPDLLLTIQNLKKNYDKLQLQTQLPDFCSKRPNHAACKNLKNADVSKD